VCERLRERIDLISRESRTAGSPASFLPAIAARCEAAASVFVDAVLPPRDTAFVPSATFIEFLDAIPIVDGQLPRWDEWWPEDTMKDLLPDDETRSVVTSEFPRLQRSFYDEQIQVTPGWTMRPCCYVRLSPAYAQECERASTWGWPIRRLDGRHLDLINTAQTVAELVTQVVDELHHPSA